jgi:excisionase family DNA binding protein
MAGIQTANALAPRGLSVLEASKYAGATIWFIRSAIWDKRLPALRLGKKNVILRDDLDRFLDAERGKQF